jgi:hypothetical protein
MSSAISKPTCITCAKGVGQFKCEGCSQIFCTKHVAEHRQTLNQELDEVIVEHDTFQQTILEDKNQSHTLIVYIDQWEQTSIDKIRQVAKEVREKVSQLADKHNSKYLYLSFYIDNKMRCCFVYLFAETITQELHHLKEQIRKAREEDDFFETDLRNWSSILKKLKQELKIATLSNNITEDQTLPLIHQIQIFSPSSSPKAFEVNDTNRSSHHKVESNAMPSNEKPGRRNGNSKFLFQKF